MTSTPRLTRSVRRGAALAAICWKRAWRPVRRAVAPTVIASAAAVAALLLTAATSAGQLPPEVQADAYLLEVEQAIDDGNYERAWDRLQDIASLQTDNDLELPEFPFWYAKAADAMNMPEQALASVTEYLTAAGREAAHYAEALALLNALQAAVRCLGWDADAYFETATPEQVTACLETGTVDLDARDASGLTPLHAAAVHAEDPAVVQALLDAGAQVEATDTASGATPLSLAIRENGIPAIVEVLLAGGSNPETPDETELTPLHLAAMHTDDPVVYEILLRTRRDLTTPEQVLEAAERSIEILIENGATPTHLEQALDSLMTDLAAAGIDVGNDATAQALLDGLRTSARCQGWNTNAYFATATAEQIATCLGTGSVDLEARSASGLTPLQAAAVDAQDPDVIEALLAAGAEPTATNSRVESGRLEAGDAVRPWYSWSSREVYQDRHSFEGGFETVLVEVRSDDFDPHLVVELPSGTRFANDDYQGDDERSQLALTLVEVGEYQVWVSSSQPDESGAYTLRVTREMPGYLAAKNNENPAVLQVFLDTGLDPNHKRDDGSTPLHQAALYNENPAVAQLLLAAGADPREDNDWGRTPLHEAARNNGNPAVIEVLLTAGADVTKEDDSGGTPLHLASVNANPAVAEALIAAGADPKAKTDNDYTPLHFASRNANPAVAETLIAAGADPKAKADDDYTPLHLAALSNENPAVIEALLDAGADLEAETNVGFLSNGAVKFTSNNRTPLNLAAQYSSSPAVIETLIAAGADLETRDRMNFTPLHRAARYNRNPVVIETLIAAGADVEAELDPGVGAGYFDVIARSTPLHEAASFGSRAVVETLLAAGADPMKRDDDRATLVHRAARHNDDPTVLEALLEVGADLEARDDEGRTPLHLAAQYNENPAIIDVLVDAGSNLEALDEDGRTPLHRATEDNDSTAVRQALLRAGAGETERANAPQQQQGDGIGRGVAALFGGAAIAVAGAQSGADPEAIADAIGEFAGGVLAEQPAGASGGGFVPSVASWNSIGLTGDASDALRNLEVSCGETYRSGFAENDHGRFYCLDAFARHCALKQGHNQQHLDALKHDYEVLRGFGRASSCPYLGAFGVTYSGDASVSVPLESTVGERPVERESPGSDGRARPTCADGGGVPNAVVEGRKTGCTPAMWCRYSACETEECRRRYRPCEPGVLR